MKKAVPITGACLLLAMTASCPVWAQSKKDPLTDQQIEDVREAGDQPLKRIKLFVGYVDDRSTEIHELSKTLTAQNREVRIHTLYEEFTRLEDDLQDNMDAFDEQHADLRKALKEIVDKSGAWTTVLNEPKPSEQYDFARKSALDSNQSLHDGAVQMLAEEEKYIADQKKAAKQAEKDASKSETR